MGQQLNTGKIGDVFRVKRVIPCDISSKLVEMGLFENQVIEILYKAPFGDPIAFRVGDYVLSMRKQEASYIEVEKC